MFLLLGAAVFGILSGTKVKTLRNDVAATQAQRENADRLRLTVEKEVKARAAKVATDLAKVTENENRVASAEAEVVKTQTEKSDLQAKLQANESQIGELQKRVDEMTKAPAKPDPGAPSVSELQAQLDEARKQLDNAEREKQLITENIRNPQARSAEVAVKQRDPGFRGSIRGTVLAVNRAYNFVVLNLGNRQGVESNAEMLVLRGGTMIGKIRISSVEPATAIGDILSGSLARGVQVQPGDTVIYAGSNS